MHGAAQQSGGAGAGSPLPPAPKPRHFPASPSPWGLPAPWKIKLPPNTPLQAPFPRQEVPSFRGGIHRTISTANRTIRSDGEERAQRLGPEQTRPQKTGVLLPQGLLLGVLGRGNPTPPPPRKRTPAESCPVLPPQKKKIPSPVPPRLLTQEDQRAEVEDAPHPTARHGPDHPDSARYGSVRFGYGSRYDPGRRCRRMRGGLGRAGGGPRRPGSTLPGRRGSHRLPAQPRSAPGSRFMPATGPGSAGTRRPLFAASLRGSCGESASSPPFFFLC